MNTKRDKITLTGAVLGAVSLLLPFITVKPNRIDDGTFFHLIHAVGLNLFLIYILLIMLLFFGAYNGSSKRFLLSKTLISFFLIALLLYMVGPICRTLIAESMPYGRISLSSGFWLSLLSIFLILNGILLHIKKNWIRFLFQIIPIFIGFFFIISKSLDSLSLLIEFELKQSRLVREILHHLTLTGTAVLWSLLLGIPLGILSWKRRKSEKPIFYFLNSVQTIPSLALFGLLIAPLSFLSFKYPFLREMGIQGIGNTPALIALTLYALLPIARNTFIGLSVVDIHTIQAGKGMGMNGMQLFWTVEIPMALPIILSGIRISSIQAIGNAAVAALIGAGGLGIFIFQGLGQGAPDLILLGVIPLIALAVILDRFLAFIIRISVSPGLRE